MFKSFPLKVDFSLPLQYSHSKILKAEGLAEWYFTHVKVYKILIHEGVKMYPTVSLHPQDTSAIWLQIHYCPPVFSAHAEHFLLQEHYEKTQQKVHSKADLVCIYIKNILFPIIETWTLKVQEVRIETADFVLFQVVRQYYILLTAN